MRRITSHIEYDDAAHLEIFTAAPSGLAFRTHPLKESEPQKPSGGVVMIHGTMVTARVYLRGARLLASRLGEPVHVYNRRGRGGSSAQLDDASLESEARDAMTVMKATGARDVLGHSFGGSVALMLGSLTATGRAAVPVRKIATFDAALNVESALNALWDPHLVYAHQVGDTDRAWAMIVRGLRTAGPLSAVPQAQLELLSQLTQRTPTGRTMRALVPSTIREVQAILEAPEMTLLPGMFMVTGQFSPDYFHRTMAAVAAEEPTTRTLRAPGYWHDGPIRAGWWLMSRYANYFREK